MTKISSMEQNVLDSVCKLIKTKSLCKFFLIKFIKNWIGQKRNSSNLIWITKYYTFHLKRPQTFGIYSAVWYLMRPLYTVWWCLIGRTVLVVTTLQSVSLSGA